MDTTKKNVLMCAKAEEIQKAWVKASGDFFYDHGHIKVLMSMGFKETECYSAVSIKCMPVDNISYCWLPTQAQLQKMVIDEFDDVQDMFYNFGRYIYDEPYNTAEQLWLAFVMATEKYNKIWDGKEWVIAQGP